MKQRNIKTVSIMLCTLVIAIMMPIAEAANTMEEKKGENSTLSSIKYFMVGIILLHYEVIVDYWFIYGFRTIAVLCIEYQNEAPVDFYLLGPRYYIDFDDFCFEGIIGPFVIRGVLTKRCSFMMS
jgi:hypothetical protein